MKYKLLPLSEKHLDEAAAIERECFSAPWSRAMLAEELKNESAAYLAAEAEGGRLLGYAGLHVVLDEGYITNIAVRTDARRRGIASALLGVLIRFSEAHRLSFLTLEVRESNVAAIALYARHGFESVGKRKNYYEDPREDAVLMTRFFSPGNDNGAIS
jgi:ribosomal-protein-alanine N-acetyltransferase